RVQQQTGIPYALLDGRFEGIPLSYRTLGALIGRREQGESFARNAEDTMKTITQRVGSIPPADGRAFTTPAGRAGWRPGSAARSMWRRSSSSRRTSQAARAAGPRTSPPS